MNCPCCSSPISFFRTVLLFKPIECKQCGALLKRAQNPKLEGSLAIFGIIAIKLLALKFNYWLSLALVLLVLSFIDNSFLKLTILKWPDDKT